MIDRVLARAARLAVERPRSVLAASAIPALVSLLAFTVPLDFSFAGLIDRSHPEVQRYFEASERHGLGGLVPVLLEGPEAQLEAAVAELLPALEALPEVRSVVSGPPEDWLRARAPYLVQRDVFEDWIALALEPSETGDPPRAARLQSALDGLAAQRKPAADGARLLVITLASDTFELALDAEDFPIVRALTKERVAPFDVRASFAGMPAIVTQEQEATIERMRWLGPASLLIATAFLLSFERRVLALVGVACSMLLAVGCTIGIVGAIAGELTIMESVFGVLVFGLGIDFAIHLLLRVREERRAGLDPAQSVTRAVTGTGRGIAAGALTSGGSFLILTLSPDPVFYRLGLAGGLGLLLCFVSLMLLFPAILTLLERRAAGRPPAPEGAVRPVQSLLGLLAGISARRPVAVASVGAVALLAVITLAPSPRYETNLERVFSRDIDAMKTARRIHALFGVDPGPWLATAPDLGEARRLGTAFEADPLFGHSESLAALFPEDMLERGARLASLSDALGSRAQAAERAIAALPPEAAETRAAELALLEALAEAALQGPPRARAGDLPDSLAERFLGPDGELLVYAFVAEPALDSRIAARERRAAQRIAPNATSMNVIYEALIGTDRPWLPRIVALLCAFVAVVLTVDLRSVRLACLALVPAAAATVFTVGLFSVLGFSFNTVTLIAIPLLIGLGVDDGIHVVHRLIEQPSLPLERTVGSVAGSIAMTTLTSCASVALLLLTGHPGIESIASLLLLGLPLCLLASVTLLPAAAVLLGVAGRLDPHGDNIAQ